MITTNTSTSLTPEMVADAKATLKTRFLADRKTHQAALHTQAERAYEDFLETTRQNWITHYFEAHGSQPLSFKDTYSGYLDRELYRASLEPDDRIPQLMGVGEASEAVKVYMHRHRGIVSLEDLKTFLAGFMPVDGDDVLLKDITDGATSDLRTGSTYDLAAARKAGKVPVLTGVSPEFRRAVGGAGLVIDGTTATWRMWRTAGEPSEF